MSSSDDHRSGNRSANGTPGPLLSGLGLWREATLAWLGLLALLSSIHGFWWLLGETSPVLAGYTIPDLLRDGALGFAGVYLLVSAAGSAATRLE